MVEVKCKGIMNSYSATYLEFSSEIVERFNMPGKYLEFRRTHIPHRYILMAERIWIEDDEGVRYMKNRNPYHSAVIEPNSVDLKEFTWIKLSSTNVDHLHGI